MQCSSPTVIIDYFILYSFYYIETLVLDSKVFLIFCPRQSYK